MSGSSRQRDPRQRCYSCGRPIADRESVELNVAPAGQVFVEIVRMYADCAGSASKER